MTEWINQRFGINLNPDDLESIKDFSLIWNIFENNVCQTNFSIASIEKQLQNKNLSLDEFNQLLIYFRNRYVTNGKTNQRFKRLNFRANDKIDLVSDVLLGQQTDTKKIILALVIITYRYRNNLFHGLKDIQVIDQQKDNFDNANRVLTVLLNHFKN